MQSTEPVSAHSAVQRNRFRAELYGITLRRANFWSPEVIRRWMNASDYASFPNLPHKGTSTNKGNITEIAAAIALAFRRPVASASHAARQRYHFVEAGHKRTFEFASAAHCFVRCRTEHSAAKGISLKVFHVLPTRAWVAIELQFYALALE